MTDHELTALMRRGAGEIDPASSHRILHDALATGRRRRRTRALAGGVGGAALVTAAVLVATGVGGARDAAGLVADGPTPTATDPATTQPSTSAPPSTAPAPGPTSYAPGSRTQVPGGPVIATDRTVVSDAALAAVARDLLRTDGTVTALAVDHTWSSDPLHEADHTRNGRTVGLTLDGAGASVTLQRWDGYAAVGLELGPDVGTTLADPTQRVATTAAEACAGAYRTFPPIACEHGDAGWYSVSRPSQGAAAPASARELYVALYTDDGYVIRVDSYNTPGEKAGDVVSGAPVLTVPESLALAGSPRWFARG